jgi:hypothetical protein
MNKEALFKPQLILLQFVGWKFQYSKSRLDTFFKALSVIFFINGIFVLIIDVYYIAFSAKSLKDFTEAIPPTLSNWEFVLKMATLYFWNEDLNKLLMELKELASRSCKSFLEGSSGKASEVLSGKASEVFKTLMAKSRTVFRILFIFSFSTGGMIALKHIVGMIAGKKDFPFRVE